MTEHPQETVTGTRPAPAIDPPRWSGKKTAIAAALAIGAATIGGAGVAAAAPTINGHLSGTSQGPGGPGGGPGGMPGGPGGMPGGAQPPVTLDDGAASSPTAGLGT